jgi:hypothetical protein
MQERGGGWNQGTHREEDVRRKTKEKGLNLEEWMGREQRRGYESLLNTSEFSNLNDLSNARNVHHEREIVRLQEILERNPQILKVAETRMKNKGGARLIQPSGQEDIGNIGRQETGQGQREPPYTTIALRRNDAAPGAQQAAHEQLSLPEEGGVQGNHNHTATEGRIEGLEVLLQSNFRIIGTQFRFGNQTANTNCNQIETPRDGNGSIVLGNENLRGRECEARTTHAVGARENMEITMQEKDTNRPCFNLNRWQGSKSWSLGIGNMS